jgi:hypothetical protein
MKASATEIIRSLIQGAVPFENTITKTDLPFVSSELARVWLPPLVREQLCNELARPLGVRAEALRRTKPKKSAISISEQSKAILVRSQTVTRKDLERLEAQYHGPTLPNAKGDPGRLNERFWAALFAHENQTIYEPFEERIYVYEPVRGLWIAQHPENLREVLAERIYQIAEARAALSPEYGAIPRFISMQNLSEVIEALKGVAYQQDAFGPRVDQPYALHLANCMLVWDGKEFVQQEFSPLFKSRNQSPISYDPTASELEFRKAFFPADFNSDDLALIRKYAGQCLLGRNISQTILLLDGVPDSSKTTLALVIGQVVGQDNCAQLRTSLLDERFEAASFIGKTILLAPDVKANFLSHSSAGVLKSLVGGDRQSAEFKRSNRRVSYYGTYNVIITSNSRLRARLEGDAEAWRRRLLIVRFELVRSGPRISDYHLCVVRDYGPGILNFMIQGLRNLLCSQGGLFSLAPSQQARVSKFIDESDSLRLFLRSNIAASSESKFDLTTNEILEAYYQSCIEGDLNSLPTKEASRALTEIIKDLFGRSLSGSLKRDGKNQKGFSKLKWRDSDDPDPSSYS